MSKTGEREFKLFPFADGVIPYFKDSKDLARKLRFDKQFQKIATLKKTKTRIQSFLFQYQSFQERNQGKKPIHNRLKIKIKEIKNKISIIN